MSQEDVNGSTVQGYVLVSSPSSIDIADKPMSDSSITNRESLLLRETKIRSFKAHPDGSIFIISRWPGETSVASTTIVHRNPDHGSMTSIDGIEFTFSCHGRFSVLSVLFSVRDRCGAEMGLTNRVATSSTTRKGSLKDKGSGLEPLMTECKRKHYCSRGMIVL